MMVILLLSIIAVLAAGRTGLLNEALVGSDSDYNRALAAAEALLRDAELDVQGRAPVTGFFCRGAPGIETELPGIVGCRDTTIAGSPWFPTGDQEWEDDIEPLLAAAPAASPCVQAICAPANMTTLIGFEDNPTTMAAMVLRGARYGEHTLTNRSVGNPILAASGALPATQPGQGWYWVEVFKFDMGAVPVPPALDDARPSGARFIYRITAIALGQKAGTRAGLRSFYVPNPKRFAK
ncbi:MAG: pilus assembly protein [Rhodoferax sp.]|nr:pilus assembly protein [Rhodoferax sp.]